MTKNERFRDRWQKGKEKKDLEGYSNKNSVKIS